MQKLQHKLCTPSHRDSSMRSACWHAGKTAQALCEHVTHAPWHSLCMIVCRNCSVRSEAVERRVVDLGVCPLLLSILDSPHWPNCLRDVAGGLLQSLAERWDNVPAMPGLRYATATCTGSKQCSECHETIQCLQQSAGAMSKPCLASGTPLACAFAACNLQESMRLHSIFSRAQEQ